MKSIQWTSEWTTQQRNEMNPMNKSTTQQINERLNSMNLMSPMSK
jgi:hypothetical protein